MREQPKCKIVEQTTTYKYWAPLTKQVEDLDMACNCIEQMANSKEKKVSLNKNKIINKITHEFSSILCICILLLKNVLNFNRENFKIFDNGLV